MASTSSSTNYLQRGYVPFSGNPAEVHDWASLLRSMMYKDGLGKVISRTEKAPEAPADSAETAAAAFFRKTRLPSKTRTVSSIHGCIWRRRTAPMDFQLLRLRSSSPSLQFGLRNSVTDMVLSLPWNRSTALMELIGCRNCRTSLDLLQ